MKSQFKVFIFLLLISFGFSLTEGESRSCLMVDSDGSLDDLRAIAYLSCHRGIDFLILTEGIARIPSAAAAVGKVLAETRNSDAILSRGLASGRPLRGQVAQARARDERVAEGFPRSDVRYDLPAVVARIRRECAKVDLVMLAPLTSAAEYFGRIRDRIGRAVFQGAMNESEFNCWYDRQACNTVLADALVDKVTVPAVDKNHLRFGYSAHDIERLGTSDVARLFRGIAEASSEGWLAPHLLMWDDVAAIALVDPDAFVKREGVWIPREPVGYYASLWLDGINRCQSGR